MTSSHSHKNAEESGEGEGQMELKYDKYKDLSAEDRHQAARYLLSTIRGQLIISQALYEGLKRMEERPDVKDWEQWGEQLQDGTVKLQEPSNQADMELLMAELFPLYLTISQPMNEVPRADMM